MTTFIISGMACAACSSRVENVVSKVTGVEKCSVNLLTGILNVEGDFSNEQIIKTIEDAGYGAILESQHKNESKSNISDSETKILLKRFITSVIFLLPLIYISMGFSMWHFPLPFIIQKNPLTIASIQFILSGIILLINRKFFISGAKSLLKKSPNMDTLVSLGSGISFCYSLYNSILILASSLKFELQLAQNLLSSLYFESSSMILTLITLGKFLESLSKEKTTDALKSLMSLAPKTAVIITQNGEKEIPVQNVKIGEIFILKPGYNIPVDGVVLEGNSSVNESSLTGESLYVDKKAGDEVKASTINVNGFLKCKATRVGKDTTFAQIIQIVNDSTNTKAPVAKIADKVSGFFVPCVMIISLITFVVWILLGAEISFSLTKAVCVLVVSCPCALGLATPVAIMVANGVGAKNGILFKTSTELENAGKTQIIAFDKTGTLTKGVMQVKEVYSYGNITINEVLQIAYSLEDKSDHPLARAIREYAKEKNIVKIPISDFLEIGGRGLKANAQFKDDNQITVYCGNFDFIKDSLKLEEQSPQIKEITNKINDISNKGETPIFIASNKLLGIICLSDSIKEESESAISELKKIGIKIVMLTGDNQLSANALAKQCGIQTVIANVLPDQKQSVILDLKKQGKTCMVGDGINDAPSLVTADIGIAIGNGSDIAINSANIVLLKNNLCDIVKVIRLSKKTLKIIHENLFWAFFYNVILIPVAAGVYHKFGIDMNPMFGAFAMSLSSFCVVMNALRLKI